MLKCQRRQFLSGEKLMDFLESIFCLAGWAATRIGREVKSASNPLVDGDFHISAVESVDLEASLNLMTKPAGGPIMTVSQYAQLQYHSKEQLCTVNIKISWGKWCALTHKACRSRLKL